MTAPRNPYASSAPIEGDDTFVGRRDLLGMALKMLSEPHYPGLVLCGPRKVGKTSLLVHLGSLLTETRALSTVYVSSQAMPPGSIGIIVLSIATRIARQLGMPKPKPDADAEVWFRERWLPSVLSQISPGRVMTILFDDFDFVLADPTSSRDVLAYLVGLLDAVAPRLRFVFVLGPSFLEYDKRGMLKSFPVIRVPFLSRDETENLVRLSEKKETLWWSSGAVERLWMLTQGHPFLLQSLCNMIWRQECEAGDGRPLVEVDDVEAVVEDVLDAGGYMLEGLLQGLSQNALTVAWTLARDKSGSISKQMLDSTSRKIFLVNRDLNRDLRDASLMLVEYNVLERTKDGYRFRAELMRRWAAQSNVPARKFPDPARARAQDPVRAVVANENPPFTVTLAAHILAALRRLDTAPRLPLVALALPAGALAGFLLLADAQPRTLAAFALVLVVAALLALSARPITIPTTRPAPRNEPPDTP